jgi:GNAT superfamily N-acetyltransferase
MGEPRKATPADLTGMSQSLARAFHDDPIMEHLYTQPSPQRDPKVARFFFLTAERDMGHGEVWTTPGLEATAIWTAPDQWRFGFADIIKTLPATVSSFGRRLPRALRTLTAIEKVHPREPHWYLAVLGTHPDHQGKGLGSAVLGPVLRRCDEEGVPAYLESSKESNIPFYRRHGFEVTREVTLAKGPTLYPMWREPRPPDA